MSKNRNSNKVNNSTKEQAEEPFDALKAWSASVIDAEPVIEHIFSNILNSIKYRASIGATELNTCVPKFYYKEVVKRLTALRYKVEYDYFMNFPFIFRTDIWFRIKWGTFDVDMFLDLNIDSYNNK